MSEKVEQTFNKGKALPGSCREHTAATDKLPCRPVQSGIPTGMSASCAWPHPGQLLMHRWPPLAAGNLRLLGTAVGGVFGYVVMLR